MFSIIIHSYNATKGLNRSLCNLIKANTSKYPFELIILDQVSTDNNSQIVAQYATRIFIRHIKTTGHDPLWLLKLGADKARHKYLIFLPAHIDCPDDFFPRVQHYEPAPGQGIFFFIEKNAASVSQIRSEQKSIKEISCYLEFFHKSHSSGNFTLGGNGACLLCRTEDFRELSGIANKNSLYFDEHSMFKNQDGSRLKNKLSNAEVINSRYPVFNFKNSYDAEVYEVPTFPPNFPDWLKLPPLKGVGNDYTFIEEARDDWVRYKGKSYTLGASIIIPVYNRSIELDFVLAGLVHQTYPPHLMEVVIADDGSHEDIAKVYKKYEQYFNIKYCHQVDLGYRLAEARNMGVRHASQDSIIILDSDAIPDKELVEKYMQFFHVNRNIAMFGLRRYVSLAHISPEDYVKDRTVIQRAKRIRSENDVATAISVDGFSMDWREEKLTTSNQAKDHKLPYRFFVGANCAFTRELFDRVGGFCEDFRAWGFEDQEFGYRLLREGAYFIALKDNYVYHQEPLTGKNETDRKLGRTITKTIFIEKCPFLYRKNYVKKSGFEAPLVSIYVPLFNREQFILECVQSAIEQTVKDLEVVICDDGSTDKSSELLQKYFGNNKRVRLIRQQNAGIGAASNTAVNNSRGFYIGQLDADDVLMRDAVERCLEVMEKDPRLSLVYGTTEYIDENSKFISNGWNWPLFSREYLLTKMIVHHFRFFRKRDFMRTSGFDETIKNAVDYDMMLKLSELGEVKHLNKVLYQYRRHNEMTTETHKDDQNTNNYTVINNSLKRLSINGVLALKDKNSKNPRCVSFVKIYE